MANANCKAPGCDRGHYGLGYCKKHYTQVLRYGRLTPERERGNIQIRTCSAEGCDRRARLVGYCRKHARQMKKYGRLTPELEQVRGITTCQVAGCTNKHRSKGKCAFHYNQERWLRQKEAAKAPTKRRGRRPARASGRKTASRKR
jgi:hypothetical protein